MCRRRHSGLVTARAMSPRSSLFHSNASNYIRFFQPALAVQTVFIEQRFLSIYRSRAKPQRFILLWLSIRIELCTRYLLSCQDDFIRFLDFPRLNLLESGCAMFFLFPHPIHYTAIIHSSSLRFETFRCLNDRSSEMELLRISHSIKVHEVLMHTNHCNISSKVTICF